MTGQELKNKRLNANMTQEELAKKLGTFKQKISNWENDVMSISRLYIQLLEKIFSE